MLISSSRISTLYVTPRRKTTVNNWQYAVSVTTQEAARDSVHKDIKSAYIQDAKKTSNFIADPI